MVIVEDISSGEAGQDPGEHGVAGAPPVGPAGRGTESEAQG